VAKKLRQLLTALSVNCIAKRVSIYTHTNATPPPPLRLCRTADAAGGDESSVLSINTDERHCSRPKDPYPVKRIRASSRRAVKSLQHTHHKAFDKVTLRETLSSTPDLMLAFCSVESFLLLCQRANRWRDVSKNSICKCHGCAEKCKKPDLFLEICLQPTGIAPVFCPSSGHCCY